MSDFITIGGKRIDIILKYKDIVKIRHRFNQLIEVDFALRKKGGAYNFEFFMFWSIWKCMIKKGVWPFRKPFRSIGHMQNETLYDEYDNIMGFYNNRILDVKPVAEDRKAGNLKAV